LSTWPGIGADGMHMVIDGTISTPTKATASCARSWAWDRQGILNEYEQRG